MPPGESTATKSPRYTKATHYPYRQTLEFLKQMALDRRRELATDLDRQAQYIGSLFLAITDGPGPSGTYGGLFTAEELAQKIRIWVVGGADWLSLQGKPLPFVGFVSSPMPVSEPTGLTVVSAYTEEELLLAQEILISAEVEQGFGEDEDTSAL